MLSTPIYVWLPISSTSTSTLGTAAAVANLAAIAPEPDRRAVIEALRAAFGRPVDPLRLGDQA